MATTLSSTVISLPIPRGATVSDKAPQRSILSWRTDTRSRVCARGRATLVRPVASGPTPPGISEKVSESIKKAEEACAGDAVSGECAAAWDEVEELSAAASHARDRAMDDDPLEAYCKDNPETEECRTYED